MRIKHWPHPFLEDGPGVAPEEVGPIGPIPPENLKVQAQACGFEYRQDRNAATPRSITFLDAQLSFDERDRV